ncbi:ornithine--oxo-acid transaminase [Paenibacillus sp. DMB20]|uniref:ornithine--oxo-acid transaminase n=1 Tax=Paenibacillus sp. DMB20 TaxID=1642570 RepID=UPI000627E9A6|nr:ornithine--oxo-acid transaminase [Paenibacillus sp. DMB20]KKO51097.1 ornithine--oxo-acid aminotransferase [Paenibacillus sp. DMB20]
MTDSQSLINFEQQHGVNNYTPLPLVITRAERVWVEDPEGNRYMDMLSAYSALNHGHRHPRIIQALIEQAGRVTLTSRAFHHDLMGLFYSAVSKITGKSRVLPMNTGAEAVETAIKTARRWGYETKGIPQNQAEIIVCEGNFHGRTVTVTSFSSSETYKQGFGPFTPGFKIIPYGSISALEEAIHSNTAALLIEPIQGESGIVLPPPGFLKEAEKLCKKHRILFMADEIQTGLGRTGRLFACDWEDVVPDVYILGKALGGGVMPVSAVAASDEVLGVFTPGSHGSTFGGNPLAAAAAIAALKVLEEEQLAQRSSELGEYLMTRLRSIPSPVIREVRGRGLFIGIELAAAARPYCERLKELGLLVKETHEFTIRLAPPLIITKEELDWAIELLNLVLMEENV